MKPTEAKAHPPLTTPLLRVEGVYVKPEYLLPSGSVKDRAARYVLEEGLASGRLRPGDEVIEPTSGNAGIALSYWAVRLGLNAVVFMPENMTEERKTIIRGHGARLMLTPESRGVVGAIQDAQAYAAEGGADGSRGDATGARADAAAPRRILFDQFEDEAGVEGQALMGKEAWEQARAEGIDGFDVVVAGIGTGGTLCGAGGYLKMMRPATRLIAVEPDASPYVCTILFPSLPHPPAGPPLLSGPAAVCHLQEGIGDGLVPGIVARHRGLVDDAVLVSDAEALDATLWLNRNGHPVGPSSGTNLTIARRLAGEGLRVLTFFCDRIDRYRSLPEFRGL
ncbi:MAG TPA: PLP-dependent cysteine synthase family protein [Candidatus Polarisedimenticolia bacterium]|nr:PLP-dependent cysteine synthase family protein [Candidatus Polarisedimenticolia bacterium]